MNKADKKILPFDLFLKKVLRQLIKTEFGKKPPVILVNGLAEQYESWFFNVGPLNEDFVVHVPNFYLYDTDNYLHELSNISVSWVVNRLKTYLDSFVQTPPYYLVANSSGCQTIVALAAKYPELASKLVLICPSGLGGDENLPVIDGVTKRDLSSMIAAIFYNKKDFVIDEIVQILKERFDNKKWRLGFVRMAQVTKRNSIVNELPQLKCPTLFICGEEDRIIPIWQAYEAVKSMHEHSADVQMIVIPKCGHAPQIERFQVINKFIRDFLLREKSAAGKPPRRFLRLEKNVLLPFELDRALSKANASRKKTEHIVHEVSIP